MAKRPRLLPWFVVLVLVAAACLPTLQGDFLQEDFALVHLTDGRGVDPGETLRYFFPTHLGDFAFFRPLPVVTGAVDLWFWGVNPFGFHLTNLLIHLAGTVLVGLAAARLGRHRWVGPLAALVYGLYPGHAESVAWIEQRMVGLSVVFFLLALNLLGRRKLGPCSGIAVLAALLCKESAVILPVVIFFYSRALPDARVQPRPWRTAALRALPGLAALLVYLVWRALVFGRLDTGYATHGSTLEYVLAERIYLDMPATLLRFLSPVNALVAPGWAVIAHAVLALGGGAALGIVWWRAGRGERRLVAFGSLVAVLSLAVAAPNLRVDSALANARLFSPPAVGLALMIAGTLVAVSRRWRVVAGALLALYLVPLPANLEPYRRAGDRCRAIRSGIAARAAAYDESVQVVVTGVPHKVHGVVLFVDGLMLQAALSPPFTPRRIPVVPLVDCSPSDPDSLLLGLRGPRAVLAVEEGPPGRGGVREIAGPRSDWRPPAPETLRLQAPAENAAVRLADDVAFTFTAGPGYPYYRLVFQMAGFTVAFTADRESRLVDAPGGCLAYRLSSGDVVQPSSYLERGDIGRVSGPVTWWVEGVRDYRVPLSAVARSPVGRFMVLPGGR